MIQAAGSVRDGAGQRPVMMVGLVPADLGRLADGDRIVFEAAAMGLAPMRVVILAGESPEAIREYLKPIMRPGTAELPAPLDVHRVDWRAVATDLAEAAALMAVRLPGAGPEPRLAPALERYRAAREREGL